MAALEQRQQTVVFIRHGESEAQGKPKQERRLDKYTDCYCSHKGVAQAYSLPERLGGAEGMSRFSLVVSSPLTRALMTTLLAFRDSDVPIVVHPGCRELGTDIPENRARSLSDLRADPEVAGLPHFFDVDFGLLPEGWPAVTVATGAQSAAEAGPAVRWGKGKKDATKKEARKQALATKNESFLDWCRAQSHTSIVVVTHHNFITSLLGGIKVENALPIECTLNASGLRVVAL